MEPREVMQPPLGGTASEGGSPGLHHSVPSVGAVFCHLCPIPIGQLRRGRAGEMEHLPKAACPVSAELGLEPKPTRPQMPSSLC